MDDRADVEQRPVVVDKRRVDDTFGGTPDILFYKPPEGAETQQVLDWAATHTAMANPNLTKAHRARVIRAYAVKWSLPVQVKHPDGRVTTERATPESFR